MPIPPAHSHRPDRRCSSGPSLFWTVFWGNEELARAGAGATAITWAGTLLPPENLSGSGQNGWITLEWDEQEPDLYYAVQVRTPAYGHPLHGQEWLGAAGSGFGDEFGHWVWHGSAQHPTASNEFRVRAYWWDPLDGSYYASLDWVTVSVSPGGDPEDMPGEVGDFELAAVNPVTASSVTLVWDDVAGESAYDLSYVTASDARKAYSIRWWDTSPEDANNRRLEADVTQHTFSGLTAGTTYHFVLQALGGGPDDSYRTESHVVSATTLEWPLPAPSDVGARAAPDHWGIQLRWRDNSTTESGFVIERRDGHAGEFQPLTTVDGNVTSYTDTTVQMGAEYQYRVSARRGELESWGSVSGFVGLAAPLVSIEADVDTCSEFKGDWGQFKLERSGGSLSSYYALEMIGLSLNGSSTATQSDWDEPSLLVLTIPAGRTELYVPVWPKADEVVELDEMMILNVSATSYHHYQADPASAVLTIRERDLIDIDSDNDNAFADPAQTKYEDWMENQDGKPGKVIVANDDDGDGDGVIDYADGYNWDANNAADNTPPGAAQGEKFVPVILHLPAGLTPANAFYRIEYDMALPGLDVGDASKGRLRLWTKDGSVARDWHHFYFNPGDLVYANPPGPQYYYTWSQLSALNWHTGAGGSQWARLYVEGVLPSTGVAANPITFKIDPDGAGPLGWLDDTVRTTVTQLAFVADGDMDHDVGQYDPIIGHADIGHWGQDAAGGVNGYYMPGDALPPGCAVGQVRNQMPRAPNWDNFIDRDPRRFYVRLVDPRRNADPNVVDSYTLSIGTHLANGAEDDDQTLIRLVETGVNTGVFVSRAQLLMSPDVPENADDDFWAHDGFMGRVDDDAAGDRTHRATVDGMVRIGDYEVIRQIPVFQRGANDYRRVLNVQVHIFNHVGGGAIWAEAQVDRFMTYTRAYLASAGIRVTEVLPRKRPNPARGLFTFFPGFFDDFPDDQLNTTPSRDESAIQGNVVTGTFRSAVNLDANPANDIVDIYFVEPFHPDAAGRRAYASQFMPAFIASLGPAVGLLWANQVHVGFNAVTDNVPFAVAHELMHQLTNTGDVAAPAHIFFPTTAAAPGDGTTVEHCRRMQSATEELARTGNRLLRRVP
jgi:hypothetical protein